MMNHRTSLDRSFRSRRAAQLAAVGLVLAGAGLGNSVAEEAATNRNDPSGYSQSSNGTRTGGTAKGTKRLREGSIIIDQPGYFREDGDGATFVADSGIEFGSLPNLNLERVVRLLNSADEPSSIRWSVSGEVTEFTGRNFLLISRAVYKSATPPPVPERIAN